MVDHLLEPLAAYYLKKGKAENYVMELVQLDVKYLLKVQDNDDSDAKVVNDFTKFLKVFVSKNRRFFHFSKSETFQEIKVCPFENYFTLIYIGAT